jgi:hypothetical protein
MTTFMLRSIFTSADQELELIQSLITFEEIERFRFLDLNHLDYTGLVPFNGEAVRTHEGCQHLQVWETPDGGITVRCALIRNDDSDPAVLTATCCRQIQSAGMCAHKNENSIEG